MLQDHGKIRQARALGVQGDAAPGGFISTLGPSPVPSATLPPPAVEQPQAAPIQAAVATSESSKNLGM